MYEDLYIFVMPPLLSLAPCAAGNVAANLDCSNNTVEVSWSSASGANSYMVTAVATDGNRVSCETDELQCDLTELQCGQTYSIALTAISEHCQTETHTDVAFSTREWRNISGNVIEIVILSL